MQGTPLVLFSISFFFLISYSTISLYTYGVSEDVEKVEESLSPVETPHSRSEGSSDTTDDIHETRSPQRTAAPAPLGEGWEGALDRWIAAGHYREHNLSLGIVARQMGVPQKQLQLWLRQSEYGKLAVLVATLRIEEAQRVLVEHRDWSVESVADYCGFNDRKYFHQVFQQLTGTTPAKYQQAHS